SQDWIEAKKENKAVFTKIPPGNYVFEVMASNNDGLWNTEPTRLEVVILSPFWLTWYAFVFYLLVGGTLFFIVARELRLRNQLQHSVMQERISRENEERLHQLKLHFFTNISHEFRTPLTLILSPLAILKRKSNQHADTTEQIALIEHNANRLLRLVNQILDLRKIELGKADFNPQPIDIVALSEEVFQCFSTLENDRKIRFRFESDFTTLPINIDPDKIDKLIYNLLSNAMKFTHPEGTISLQVREPGWMEPKRPEPYRFAEGEAVSGDHITVVVSNDGAGIDPVDLPNIFSRFYQAHGQIAGTGIGLHLCSEYIRLHHGQIEVFTGENMGATFLVHLPVTADEIGKGISGEVRKETRCCDQPEEAEPISVTNDDKKGRGARILVVDDNREMRNFLKEILSEHYQVLTANDGAEGLEIVREHAPDLIVSDVMMPGMDGNELCHAIKSDLNTSHLPVLLLTALSTVEHQMEGFRLGADDYVVKPFDDRLLLSRIKNLLESRERLREKFLGSPGEWKEEMQKLQPDNELIERATRAIGQYLVDPNFSTDLLASELNLSRSSLHRKLRALTNQSATEFVKFVRINKSIELIENGESNIDEICFKVGFNSHSYYSMCFKKQMGVTPSEYINRMRRENGGKKGE
ncbi:MAG: response regulator, partial [Marinilabiliales bacterium]|nr:response regulator [Marinilabiliales bacterium]